MPPGKHAALGASGAHRWMECPGSIRLSEGIEEGEPSEYALKGSAAHELAEMCLTGQIPEPSALLGDEVTLQRDTDVYLIEVTDNMVQAVETYVEYIWNLLPVDWHGDLRAYEGVGVEVRVNLEDLDPPAPMFGTADFVYLDPDTNTLHVVDYKHGQGVVVEVEGNPQLLYYALGSVLEMGVRPDRVRTTVVQPRADHEDGPIRFQEYTWDEMVAFKEELMAAAEATVAPDAPVGPVGDHCKWCPAKATCPAQKENALTVTQTAFPVEEPNPTPPAELSDEDLLAVLEVAPEIEDWIKEVRAHVKERLEKGEEIPGWKLVKKRAYRRWEDEDEAVDFMVEHGIDPYRHKVRSPYQAEQEAKSLDGVEVPEDLWNKKSSGFNLVPDDNPRPAVTPALLAAEEFNAVEGD